MQFKEILSSEYSVFFVMLEVEEEVSSVTDANVSSVKEFYSEFA